MDWNKVYVIDALAGVKCLADKSIQCCVTSPPYFRQRDYGVPGQWGQEESPAAYIERLVVLFRELRRVLTDSGTIWIVLGDSYASRNQDSYDSDIARGWACGIKRKDLLGIPWMTALALRQDGWYLRQDVIWFKPNPMPESVRDRCTRSHEYIFMFSKSDRYYYDHLSIATTLSVASIKRAGQKIGNQKGSNRAYGKKNGPVKAAYTAGVSKQDGHGRRYTGFNWRCGGTPVKLANRKSVWQIPTAMSKLDHFASFPSTIPELCIRAGSREGDMVLDPFSGTGTTLLRASILNRRYFGFDINPKYVAITQRRLKQLEGLFFRG